MSQMPAMQVVQPTCNVFGDLQHSPHVCHLRTWMPCEGQWMWQAGHHHQLVGLLTALEWQRVARSASQSRCACKCAVSCGTCTWLLLHQQAPPERCIQAPQVTQLLDQVRGICPATHNITENRACPPPDVRASMCQRFCFSFMSFLSSLSVGLTLLCVLLPPTMSLCGALR
jgi:hypothetical protein